MVWFGQGAGCGLGARKGLDAGEILGRVVGRRGFAELALLV